MSCIPMFHTSTRRRIFKINKGNCLPYLVCKSLVLIVSMRICKRGWKYADQQSSIQKLKDLNTNIKKHTSITFHTLKCAKKLFAQQLFSIMDEWMFLSCIWYINVGIWDPTARHYVRYIIIINSCFSWNMITLLTSKRFRKGFDLVWDHCECIDGQWNKKMWENQIHAVLARYTFQDE